VEDKSQNKLTNSDTNKAEKPHPLSYFTDDLIKQGDVMLFTLSHLRPKLYFDYLSEENKLIMGVKVHNQFGFLGDSKELGFYNYLVGSLSINLKCNQDNTEQNYNLGFAYPLYKTKRETSQGFVGCLDTTDTVTSRCIVETYAQAMLWLSNYNNLESDGKKYQVTNSYESLVSQIKKVQIYSAMFVIDGGNKIRPDNKYWDYDFTDIMYGDNNEYRQVVHDVLIDNVPTHLKPDADYYGKYFEVEEIHIAEELSKVNKNSLRQFVPKITKEVMGLRPVEKKEEQGDILVNLSDRDASVLCELVYEEAFFNAVADDKVGNSIAKLLYGEDKTINIKYITSFESEDARDTYNKYYEYYYSILDKYKVVATSLSNPFGYFSIAVANKGDNENKGIYIISCSNRSA